jgi:hypothetical protein
MRISTNDKNTLDRNPGDGTMNSSSVTAFLLSPHCRIYRHILLQVAVLLITINVFWYEPLQVVSLLKRFGGCLVYFLSMNAVIYTNLYILVPSFLFGWLCSSCDSYQLSGHPFPFSYAGNAF